MNRKKILHCCQYAYEIHGHLHLAHALGFGIYHSPIIQMFEEPLMWEDIDTLLKVENCKNNTVTLSRKMFQHLNILKSY